MRSSGIPTCCETSSACGSRLGWTKRRVASEVRKRCCSSNAVEDAGMSANGIAARRSECTRVMYSLCRASVRAPCPYVHIATHQAVRAHNRNHFPLWREPQTSLHNRRHERSRAVVHPLPELALRPFLEREGVYEQVLVVRLLLLRRRAKDEVVHILVLERRKRGVERLVVHRAAFLTRPWG